MGLHLLSWFPSPGVFDSGWQIGRWPSKTVKKIFIISLFKSDSVFFLFLGLHKCRIKLQMFSFNSFLHMISIQFDLTRGWFPSKTSGRLQRSLTLWRHTVLRSFSCAPGTLYSRNYNNTRRCDSPFWSQHGSETGKRFSYWNCWLRGWLRSRILNIRIFRHWLFKDHLHP